MKRVVLFSVLLISMLCFSYSQEVGLRFGDVTGGNVGIDAVFTTGEFNRIHADLSFGNGVGIDVLWDMLYKPLGNEAFYWYLGAGPYTLIGSDFALGAVGEIGLEYQFVDVPIVIGADWRPYFKIIESTDAGFNKFGFNIRWVFGK